MKEIGKFLKDTRKKQGLTKEDISNKTKMNISIIKNIEDGNIEFFSNDLTYLRYYIRSYSNSINVDFDSLEEEIEKATLTYTQSMETLEKDKIEQLNESIKYKRNIVEPTSPLSSVSQKSKNIDWTLVSLISIVTLIVAFLMYSVAVNLTSEKPDKKEPPIVDVDKDKDKKPNEKEDDDVIEPELKEINITQENANTYLISNWQAQEDFSIKTIFNSATWTQIKVNEQVINIPEEDANNKTFLPGEELVIKDKYILNGEENAFKAGDIISIRFGIMNGNEFMINNEEYTLDESIASLLGPTDVIFKLETEAD